MGSNYFPAMACNCGGERAEGSGKASSFDLLSPHGFSFEFDDTEPGHRDNADGEYTKETSRWPMAP